MCIGACGASFKISRSRTGQHLPAPCGSEFGIFAGRAAEFANSSAGSKFVAASGQWLDSPVAVLKAIDVAAPRPPRCWRSPSRATTTLPASSPSRCNTDTNILLPSPLALRRHNQLFSHMPAASKTGDSSSDTAAVLPAHVKLHYSTAPAC